MKIEKGIGFFEKVGVLKFGHVENQTGVQLNFSWGNEGGGSQHFPADQEGKFTPELQIPVCDMREDIQEFMVTMCMEGEGEPTCLWFDTDLRLCQALRKDADVDFFVVRTQADPFREATLVVNPITTDAPGLSTTRPWIVGELNDSEGTLDLTKRPSYAGGGGATDIPPQIT